MIAREIVAALGGDWHGSYGMVPGPGHSARDRSVSVRDGATGGIVIHSFAGEDWRAIKDAWKGAGLLNDRATGPSRPRPARSAPSTVNLDLWLRTKVITTDDPAGRYLTGRGCMLPDPDGDLRWLPDTLHHPTKTRWPALVGRITDAVTNEPMSLHFTFVKSDGTGKAPIEPTRLYLKGHRKKGGVVRLWHDADVTLGLVIGEGIETCLTAAHGFMPVWAALDANNVEVFPVLDGIECLTLLADADVTGINAAEKCADRWIAAGREVRVWSVGHGT